MGAISLIELILIFSLVVIPLFALVDIAPSKFKGKEKLFWVLAIIFAPAVGAILYFFVGREQKLKDPQE